MCEAGFKGVGGEAHTGQALPVCMDLRTEDSENTIPHNESVRQAPRAPLSPSPPLRSLTCPWVLWICPPPPPPATALTPPPNLDIHPVKLHAPCPTLVHTPPVHTSCGAASETSASQSSACATPGRGVIRVSKAQGAEGAAADQPR